MLGSPADSVSRCFTVMRSPLGKSGRCLETVSVTWTVPFWTRSITAADVKTRDTEARWKTLPGVFATPSSRFARPYPLARSTSPPRPIRIEPLKLAVSR